MHSDDRGRVRTQLTPQCVCILAYQHQHIKASLALSRCRLCRFSLYSTQNNAAEMRVFIFALSFLDEVVL